MQRRCQAEPGWGLGRDLRGQVERGVCLLISGWFLLVLCTLAPAPCLGQNQVLSLDGRGGYVELPPSGFDGLTEATVEAWVKWHSITGQPKRLFNYGGPLRDFSLGVADGGDLWYVLADDAQRLHEIRVPGVVERHRWHHLAAVSGPRGMQLYLDGFLLGTNAYDGSFQRLRPAALFRLGETVTVADPASGFDGLIDEVRVWRRARTFEEIRRGLASRFEPGDPDLVARWSFDSGAADDSGPAKLDGQLLQGAVVVPSTRPRGRLMEPRTLIHGHIRSGDGAPLTPVILRLREGNRTVALRLADPQGAYYFLLDATNAPLRLDAIHPSVQTNLAAHLAVRPGQTHTYDALIPRRVGSYVTTNAFGMALAEMLDQDPQSIRRFDPRTLLAVATHLRSADALLHLLNSDNELYQKAAMVLLVRFGRATLPVVQALSRATESSDSITRGFAVLALRFLEVPEEFERLYAKRYLAVAYLFAGLLAPFALIHILLFLIYPQNRENLHYSVFALAAAVLTYLMGRGSTSFVVILAASLLFMLSGLRFLYSQFSSRLPLFFWLVTGPASLSLAVLMIWRQPIDQILTIEFATGASSFSGTNRLLALVLACAILLVVLAEMFRVILFAALRRASGALLIGSGFFALLFCGAMYAVILVLLFAGRLSAEEFGWWSQYFPYAGILAFVLCASIHLARNLAHAYRQLRTANAQIEAQNNQLAQAKLEADRARENADAANRAKSQFLASMSHELRTPLNAIIGYSELLEDEAKTPAVAGMLPDLQRIQAAAKHQLALVNDILDFSKIEAGKMTLCVEEFDVAQLVKEVAATVQPLVAKNKNTLVVECAPDVGRMQSDQTKVRQTLFNLLSNASKFTGNGIIRVTAQRVQLPSDAGAMALPGWAVNAPESFIRLSVADSGIGMSPEQVQKLFQPFSQADVATHKKYGGTGLGLAISKRFCEMMGGDLVVQSELGKGSVFTATLPERVEDPGLFAHAG